jgi:hypothetical protein
MIGFSAKLMVPPGAEGLHGWVVAATRNSVLLWDAAQPTDGDSGAGRVEQQRLFNHLINHCTQIKTIH